MTEAIARRAGADDAAELIRLRIVMLSSVEGADPPAGEWTELAAAALRRRLPGPDARIAAFVVDRPGEPGKLAACAVGVIEDRLGNPSNPSGRAGYVFNVATDRAYRRRGYSRACMLALIGWFADNAVAQVDLRASTDGQPLYEQLGFEVQPGPSMRLKVS